MKKWLLALLCLLSEEAVSNPHVDLEAKKEESALSGDVQEETGDWDFEKWYADVTKKKVLIDEDEDVGVPLEESFVDSEEEPA